MAKQVIKFWDKVIVVLLGWIGISGVFNSCKMYGMPDEKYFNLCELNGIVTDKETSNPIQNIQIIRGDRDTIHTDADGKYVFREFLSRYHLKFEDIDGEENGGEFETQEIDVKFTQDDKVEGKFAKTINIELEKKK